MIPACFNGRTPIIMTPLCQQPGDRFPTQTQQSQIRIPIPQCEHQQLPRLSCLVCRTRNDHASASISHAGMARFSHVLPLWRSDKARVLMLEITSDNGSLIGCQPLPIRPAKGCPLAGRPITRGRRKVTQFRKSPTDIWWRFDWIRNK